MFDRILDNRILNAAAGRLGPGRTVQFAGVWGSSSALIAAAMGRLTGKAVLLVVGHLDQADEIADDIEVLTGKAAELFPAREVEIAKGDKRGQAPFSNDNDEKGASPRLSPAPVEYDEVGAERIRVCNLLEKWGQAPSPSSPVIVAPVMGLLQGVPGKSALATARLTVRKGQRLDPEELIRWLVDAGFDHVEQVDQQGEFAHRGGIVDIFPPAVGTALRVEFFGDEIDSIRKVDLDSQRSVEELPEYDITGCAAASGEGQTHLLEYLPEGSIVCMVEPGETMLLAMEIYRRSSEEDDLPARARDEDGEGAAVPSGAADGRWSSLIAPEVVFGDLKRMALLEMHQFAPKEEDGEKGGQAPFSQQQQRENGASPHFSPSPFSPSRFSLGIRSLERMSINTHEALEELQDLCRAADVWVFCENAAEEKRFRELIDEGQPDLAKVVRTSVGHVNSGFYWPAEKLVIVGHHEVFHRYAKVRRVRRIRSGRPIESLLDLSESDYVVHVAHGIARFEGLRTMERDGRSEEYLTLRFADNAVLHVPTSKINLVQKYIGTPSKKPNLSKLGGAGWLKQKARVEEAVLDMAAEMLRVQAMRRAQAGYSYASDTEMQRQFVDEFLYTETEDQITSMRQIEQDMLEPRPMDRLLCGDVGYGKTELAMRAAFKVVEAGRQVAVLVPTTVLAAQHARTFGERLADYPVRVESISRFRTAAEQKEVVKRLGLGQVDILIGTHRLLSKDVKFPDLGLVIIDEEQRFGVEHKEHLKGLRASVDVLTMTATPIPRTLHMSLLGLRDISNLSTPPLDRRAIHTEVVPYSDALVRMAIGRELNRQGQVFFVHNRVNDIRSLAAHVQELVPEARIAIGHGQMAEGELEKTMLRFVRQEIDVLVCTTIIESGLDIPTANTILIHNADRFGLADMHQLRGRVGRYKHRAFCYLLLPEEHPVTPTAAKRLKAIEDFSDLGAGFQIAMRDLEIRGAGNILGKEQSGHIATVGYELYCQLLERAVQDLQGVAAPLHTEVHVELGIDALIPLGYVPAGRQRMEIYRRLYKCGSVAEIEQLSADLRDAYGHPPSAVQTLLDQATIRVLAGQAGISSIIRHDPDIIFRVHDFKRLRKAFDQSIGSVRLADEKTMHWRPPPAYLEDRSLLNVLLKRLRQAAGTV